ncbi:amidohydrolase family protein [Actinomadura sp. ATCC 31491]|uniref:Amidohydrolase family protein n=1 Tax=Actinomadura luzonensis TaxID=2805427 RepID=A0ABT0G2B7_9ACTN|nr:amidohydrolase family protein [Actinomadura luzonensis]MCK2218325.1 amidohydrolase family protein [Actinomadura luzonensis]
MPRATEVPRYLITHVHVVAGDGTELHDADVALAGGRITAVTAGRARLRGAQVIDGGGETLIPGLIDAHLHLDFLQARNNPQAESQLQLVLRPALRELLRHGITSIRCMGDPLGLVVELRDRIAAGEISGPHLVVAGPVLTAPGGHPAVTVGKDNPWLRRRMVIQLDSGDQARDAVRELHAAGVDVVKLVYQGGRYGPDGIVLAKLRPEVMRAVIDEAHRLGLPVSAHTHHQGDVEELLAAGVDALEHGVLEEDLVGQDVLRRWAESGAWLIPTLYITTLMRDWAGRLHTGHASRNLRLAQQAGVRVAAGTDSMVGALPASTLHEELRLMAAAGIPPADLLPMVTRNAAQCLRSAGRGVVAEGNIADVVLLGSDPLDRIENVGDIDRVFSGGRLAHHYVPPAPPRLNAYRPAGPAILTYADDTGTTTAGPAVVTYDTTCFSSLGLRRITYADPATGRVLRTETVVSEPDLTTTAWTCDVPDEATRLTAERKGRHVTLSGRFGGAEVSRSYPLRGRPWMQSFLFDPATFVTTAASRLCFLSIGTAGPGALAMTEFELTRTGRQALDEAGGRPCAGTRLVIPQFRRFWAALSWYDVTDGTLVLHHVEGQEAAAMRLRPPRGCSVP